jgi:hypothetical protein
MRSIIAKIFLITYLFTSVQLAELFKLPMLAEHFIEHQQAKPQISLWEFLCVHYAHGEVMDHDFDQDMKLPFKSHSGCSCSVLSYIEPIPHFDLSRINLFPTGQTEKNFGYQSHFIPKFSHSIWQPPKIA